MSKLIYSFIMLHFGVFKFILFTVLNTGLYSFDLFLYSVFDHIILGLPSTCNILIEFQYTACKTLPQFLCPDFLIIRELHLAVPFIFFKKIVQISSAIHIIWCDLCNFPYENASVYAGVLTF